MGRLFVVSAPSGSGKTTLCQRLLKKRPDFCYSVSYTTRPPRAQERNGVDYNFISLERFQSMIASDDFLEWAQLFGRYYGTGKTWVLNKLKQGLNVLVDIDVLGARQIKRRWPEAVLVFIIPPTYDELVKRLTGRLTENAQALAERLRRAVIEISQRHLYDYLLINDNLDLAEAQLLEIMEGRLEPSMKARENFWPAFFANHPELSGEAGVELPAEQQGQNISQPTPE